MNNEKLTELTQGIAMDSLVFEICQADALNSAEKAEMRETSIHEHEPVLWELQKMVNQSVIALCGLWLSRPDKRVLNIPAGSVKINNASVNHVEETLHVPAIACMALRKYGRPIAESWMSHLSPPDAETEEVGELLSPAELRIQFFAVASPDQVEEGWFGWGECGQVARDPSKPFEENIAEEIVTFRLRNELPRWFRGQVDTRFPWDDVSFSHHLAGVALGLQSQMERDFHTATETLKLLGDNVS